MIKIGITGLIASGKSTVAKILSNRKYPIFDADYEVKKIYQKNLFKKKIYKKFRVTTKKEIKRIVNNNPKKLIILEKIIHPLVRKELKNFVKRNKRKKLLLFDIPLLIESKLMSNFHSIIFVNCRKEIRKKRFQKKRKNKKLFNILDKRQLKPVKKIKSSNYVINNNFSFKMLKDNVNIIRQLILMSLKNYE